MRVINQSCFRKKLKQWKIKKSKNMNLLDLFSKSQKKFLNKTEEAEIYLKKLVIIKI